MNQTMTAAPPQTTVSEARAALTILEHAARIGLPLPFNATVTTQGPPTFHFDNLAEVTDWAKWMEAQIESESFPDGSVHHRARGAALDHPIKVVTVTFAATGSEASA